MSERTAALFRITTAAIDAPALEAAVSWPGAGAVLTFQGVTRDNFKGQPVTGLHYEAYAPMAVAKMAEIAAEIDVRWPGTRVAMSHRIGELAVGEVSVVISIATPHRGEAYAASRYAIDELKARVPIWKKEHYADGQADWKENERAR